MNKKPSRHFFRILIILFILFTSLYIAMESGYYESKISQKTTLTKDKMIQFEKDVNEGKNIDINDYLEEETKDYSSKVSKAGMNISNGTEKFMTSGISEIFKFIGNLFS